MLNTQNQNFQYQSQSHWRPLEQTTVPLEGTLSEWEQIPPQVYIKIPDVTELKEQIKREIITELKRESVREQIIPIQFLESERLKLRQPVVVSLGYSQEGGIWVVDCPELNLYGEGKDESQAIKDFKVVLEEFYFSLKKDKEKLGSELKQKWNILQKVIQEK